MPAPADTLLVLSAGAIPVFFWALLNYLDAFPGFALRLNIWDLIGTASYTLATALIESIVLVMPFILVAILLPSRFRQAHFVAVACAIILISCIWLMYANYQRVDLSDLNPGDSLPFLVFYLLSIVIPVVLILRYRRIEEGVRAVMSRASILATVYLLLGCLSIVVILIRNL